MNRKSLAALAIVTIVVVAAVAAYEEFYLQGPCQPQKATETESQSQLKGATFGAVTEYALPGASPWANGIMVAPDGSVWFGEEGAPGVGHFDQKTGSLVEYLWPCYPSSKIGPLASIWGIASWNGGVWATDGDANRLVGLNPGDGSVRYVNTTSAQFPYLFAAAPDGSLWFTSLTSPARVGRLGTDLALTVFEVTGVGHEEPIQMRFVNTTLAYLVALNPYNDTDSGLYSFDPAATQGQTIAAHRVGGDFRLMFPQALDVAQGKVWVAQHLPSNIVSFDSGTGQWTVYPTSTISYESTTLPYFVQAQGGGVWFNEHYANSIAFLNPSAGTLTEFSESDPPAKNGSMIQNDLTMAATPFGAWFTSTTGNYIGFVNASVPPRFSLGVVGLSDVTLSPGLEATVRLEVSGVWGNSLDVKVSDSENFTSKPYLISVSPDRAAIPAGSGPVPLAVTLSPKAGLAQGRYLVGVTVTDGLVSQTAYIFVTVP